MTLTDYRTLGRSGLVVSPLALGAMTFGAGRWGTGEAESRAVLEAYVGAGGNFIDCADVYSGGGSDEMVGRFVAERGLRDQMVLATKAGFNRAKGNPNASGNGAKNVRASLEQSLRRLGTDYVDLFWLHVWDTVTPAEEALQTLGDLVRAGMVRYFGVSNAPAWFVTRMATLAAAHGVPGPVAMQLQYSLVDRDIEREHVPMARELGLAVQPWAPLAAGFLTGKYERAAVEGRTDGPRGHELPDSAGEEKAGGSDGRLNGANPFGDSLFTPRNWEILEVLRRVAAESGHSMAQVALRWAVGRPGICAPVVGASRAGQMDENVAALGIELSAAQVQALDEASPPTPSYPYPIFSRGINRMVFGGAAVSGWTLAAD